MADVFGAFNSGPQPTTLCALTFVCTPLQDSHPTDLGYEVIAQQIWTASDYDRLRPGGGNHSDQAGLPILMTTFVVTLRLRR